MYQHPRHGPTSYFPQCSNTWTSNTWPQTHVACRYTYLHTQTTANKDICTRCIISVSGIQHCVASTDVVISSAQRLCFLLCFFSGELSLLAFLVITCSTLLSAVHITDDCECTCILLRTITGVPCSGENVSTPTCHTSHASCEPLHKSLDAVQAETGKDRHVEGVKEVPCAVLHKGLTQQLSKAQPPDFVLGSDCLGS